MTTLFTAHKTEMAAALAAVIGAIEKRNTIPILSNVLVRPAGDALMLTATNLDIEITSPCPLTQGDLGGTLPAFTVAGRTLEDIVKKMPESADIRFDGNPEREIKILGGRSRFTLHTLPPADFPLMDQGTLPVSFALSAATLTGLFAPVQFAISDEEARYYLNGIYLHTIEEGGQRVIAAVATDGHRLAFRRLAEAVEGAGDFPGVIVPANTVALVLKLAKALKGDAVVGISLSQSRIVFDFDGTRLASKLIDGTFPDYSRVVPKGNPNRSRFAVADLTAAIERVSTIAGERGRAVRLVWGADTLTLAVNNPDAGQSEDAISVERLAGDDVEIGFNARYTLDMAARVGTAHGEAALGDPGSPAVFTPAGDETTLFVLMPMRV